MKSFPRSSKSAHHFYEDYRSRSHYGRVVTAAAHAGGNDHDPCDPKPPEMSPGIATALGLGVVVFVVGLRARKVRRDS